MPQNADVWVVGIVVVGLILALGLWFGRRFTFSLDPKTGMSFKSGGTPARRTTHKVFNDGIAEESEIEEVTGGSREATTGANLDVANRAHFKKSKVGRISGTSEG